MDYCVLLQPNHWLVAIKPIILVDPLSWAIDSATPAATDFWIFVYKRQIIVKHWARSGRINQSKKKWNKFFNWNQNFGRVF